ncbi:hypothetical protein N431DRAFT_457889 [Stipitochalara longipes BDJ]|nr:hypothetical protein N431DRAFT_457889 [Stipitochalara longipes BDJ]
MADASPTSAITNQSSPSPSTADTSLGNEDMARDPDFANMDEVVTLVVDSYGGINDKSKFVIHKSFACHYSSVLKALLIQWMYTQKVDTRKLKEEAAGEIKSQSLVYLWALAESVQIPRIQNAIIRELQALRDHGESVPTLSLAYVYQNFPPANPLRRLLLHQCAGGLDSWYANCPEQFSKTMLLEVTVYQSNALQAGKSATDLRENTNLSDYYVPEV